MANADVCTFFAVGSALLRWLSERGDGKEGHTELQGDEAVKVSRLGLVDQEAEKIRERTVDDFRDPRVDEGRPEQGGGDLDWGFCSQKCSVCYCSIEHPHAQSTHPSA